MEESHTRSKPYDDDVLARTRRGPLEQAEKCNRGVGAETPLAVALPPPLTAAAAPLSMSVCDGQPHHPLHITEKKETCPCPLLFPYITNGVTKALSTINCFLIKVSNSSFLFNT
jgi:hypothetical protein